MSLLQVRDLRVEYPGLLLLDGIDMRVDDGELVAIETGVLDGGTSLLKAIAGLLRGCGGEVVYRGENLLQGASEAVAASIGFVYEERGLISLYTVYQNISLPLRFHTNLTEAQIEDRITTVCERLGLDASLLTLSPHQLNDVQTRLVNLARALVVEPGLLLVDELEGGMSEEVVVATMQTIRSYQAEHPMSVIMTTSSDLVIERSDRVYDIKNRSLVAQGVS